MNAWAVIAPVVVAGAADATNIVLIVEEPAIADGPARQEEMDEPTNVQPAGAELGLNNFWKNFDEEIKWGGANYDSNGGEGQEGDEDISIF